MQETDEQQASTWRRPLKGWRWLAGWAVVIVTLAALTRIVLGLTTATSSGGITALPWWLFIGIALAVAILIGLLVRCLFSWRNFKRLVLGLACLAGLIVLFYAEEDIRGRLAWRHFKAQWEAKGEKFDLAAFIPPPVQDDQNFAMTPVVSTSYGQMLDRHGHQLFPPNTNVVNRLQMPLDAGDGGPTNGIGNWQKAISSNLEPWQRYYRQLSLRTNLFAVPPQPQTPAADVLLALSKYDSTIEELRRAAAPERPQPASLTANARSGQNQLAGVQCLGSIDLAAKQRRWLKSSLNNLLVIYPGGAGRCLDGPRL